MRTALVGQVTLRFDAKSEVGPSPREGSVIEDVRHLGRNLELEWDDGVVLATHLRLTGEWHLYRQNERWRKATYEARVVVEVEEWVAVCFNASHVETFRVLDRGRHPQSGGAGPDISIPEPDLVSCTQHLLSYKNPETAIADVLADNSVVVGLGNVVRSEVLWAVGLSPFATIGDLSYEDCEILVETASRLIHSKTPLDSAVYGRHGQQCQRCRGTVQFKVVGEYRRGLFWCSDCQERLDRRLIPGALLDSDSTPSHPAEVLYMSEMREARKRLQIFDDLSELG
jgi:endonuclease-8